MGLLERDCVGVVGFCVAGIRMYGRGCVRATAGRFRAFFGHNPGAPSRPQPPDAEKPVAYGSATGLDRAYDIGLVSAFWRIVWRCRTPSVCQKI